MDVFRKVIIHTGLHFNSTVMNTAVKFESACVIPEPTARSSGRKPGARVTNFVLAEFKVVARGS